MAQVPKTSLKQFKDGPPPVKAADLNQNNEVLRTAINDNDGRIGAVEADGSVTTAKLANGAVTTVKLGDNAVTSAKIATNAVTTDKLPDRSVTAPKIALTAVGTEHLQDLSVTSVKLAEGAVTSTKLGANAVTSSSIASGAVDAGKLADLGVTTAKLGNNVVTTEKLADGAVTTNILGANSVNTAKIADKSVTSAKLADNAVTPAGLNVYTKPETDTAIANALAGGLPPEVVDEITGAIVHDVTDLKHEVSGIETDVANLKDADIAMQAEITALQQAVPPDASTTQKGIVQLTNSFTSTSTTLAPTANAVKTAYDTAVAGMRLRNVNNGTNLDTLTQIGVYRIVDKANFPNSPDSYGVLQVYSDTPGYVTQKFIAVLTAKEYTRGRNESGTWTGWREVASSFVGDVTSPLVFRGQVSGDFNSYTQTGYYIVASDSWTGVLNYPRDNTIGNAYAYGVLEVINSGQGLSQFYRQHSDSRVWTRSGYSNASWAGWKRLLTTDDYDTLFQLSVDTKGKVATAINGKGGTANSGMTGDQLATAISNLNLQQFSSGNLNATQQVVNPGQSASFTLPIDFTPSVVFVEGNYQSMISGGGGQGWYAFTFISNLAGSTQNLNNSSGGSRGGYDAITISGTTISIKPNSTTSNLSYHQCSFYRWYALK